VAHGYERKILFVAMPHGYEQENTVCNQKKKKSVCSRASRLRTENSVRSHASRLRTKPKSWVWVSVFSVFCTKVLWNIFSIMWEIISGSVKYLANLDEILKILFKTKHVCGLLTNDHFEPFWTQISPFNLGGGGVVERSEARYISNIYHSIFKI
jgi:hypothetical protein